MKADLDRLMAERDLNALLTLPTEHEDHYRNYLSNGAQFSGFVVKKRGHDPVLITGEMEREEAARSGLTTYVFEDFNYSQILREYKADRDRILTEFYRRIFEKLGIEGKICIYGVGDANSIIRTVQRFEEYLSDVVQLVPDTGRTTIFDEVVQTKSPDEIARLRDVAARTSAVMRNARAWLGGHKADGEIVVKADGSPLTVGDFKRYVRGQLHEHDLEEKNGMIFAPGRDGGIPHSTGEADTVLRVGQPIVFDLFPREPQGYFHDVTRTWCLGHAPEEAQAAWDLVKEAFDRSVAMCKPGTPTHEVQIMVCELFEENGHPTVLNTPGTTDGYVHTLAHGVGLQIHESPFFRNFDAGYKVQIGNVFTIEPGLYYPERGYGMRIEDSVLINEAGEPEHLTDVPYDLVIELQ